MSTGSSSSFESTFSKYFECTTREPALYELWEKAGAFVPQFDNTEGKEPFVVAMPPPNANGELHLGHSYGYTIMDSVGRYHRMQGRPVLLIPGKDHAGIQTQVVYEQRLRKEGIDTTGLSREELFKKCYEFCTDRAQYMRAQEKTLGLSADWEKELFTLDPRLTRIIYETFTQMWQQGLVYKGKRIVNWSVLSQTSISDVEVEYKDAEGSLTYIRYPFVEALSSPSFNNITLSSDAELIKGKGDELIVVLSSGTHYSSTTTFSYEDRLWIVRKSEALKESLHRTLSEYGLEEVLLEERSSGTLLYALPFFETVEGLVTTTTRPETMLGDTAMAVHPDDPRYQHLVGTSVKVPLIDRVIPIIADKRVEMQFGTGVVKVTPAHDFLDYELGVDHQLEIIQVIGPDGKMTQEAGRFAGLYASKCRTAVQEALKENGALIKIDPYTHKVPISERGKDVIEPLISDQWWVAVDKPGMSLKKKAREMLEKIEIYPPRFKKEFENWLDNLRDWNISRQLWWGHQLPVWYHKETQEIYVGVEAPQGDEWVQETDTFDTWFSSGQWAFSTTAALGLYDIEAKESISGAYPTQLMVMGRDILFFWACRMLLLSACRTEEIPWKSIYFTGLIRDSKGQKMSKSKGNGIEPKELITEFGADALRISLLMGATPGNDVQVGKEKVGGYSKFVNKLWNAAKLLEGRIAELPSAKKPSEVKLSASKWILGRVEELTRTTQEHFEECRLGQAAADLYSFVWTEYCDWYLEMFKILARSPSSDIQEETAWCAIESFRGILSLLHPLMPFVTEEIFQQFKQLKDVPLLCTRKWERSFGVALGRESSIPEVIETVEALRSMKVALDARGAKLPVVLPGTYSEELSSLIEGLAQVQLMQERELRQESIIRRPLSHGVVLVEHPDKDRFVAKLQEQLVKRQEELTRLEEKLSSEFLEKAPEELVVKEKERQQGLSRMVAELRQELQEVGTTSL